MNRQSNRKTFYHSAVYALAPGIPYWEAKADYEIERRYMTDCQEMIGRLIRALKACDDVRFHLGALQTIDSYDDVGTESIVGPADSIAAAEGQCCH